MEEEILQPQSKEYFIKKLHYLTREEAYLDLIAKGIIDEEERYLEFTEAVVDIPRFTTSEDREDLSFISEFICFDLDLMLTKNIEFESEINPATPSHNFGGWELPNESDIELPIIEE